MKLWTIYALVCPITSGTKYIGITSGTLKKRLQSHLHEKDHNREKVQWITWLHLQGLRPVIVPIDSVVGTRLQAEQRERYWVYKYIKAGHDLLNRKHIAGDRESFLEFLRNQSKVL